jgi:SAM-dependent methyltransferase
VSGDIASLLASYPRVRPALSPAHQASYVEHYRANRSDQGISMRLEKWMHRQIGRQSAASILEIGAGNLNHVPYHPGAAAYDVVEPFRELWEDSPYRGAVRTIYRDIAEVAETAEQPAYDLILSAAVLEHLTELPDVIARSALLLREGGRWCAAFPSEGGFLWGLAWRCTTGVAYRLKWGLDYAAIRRYDHVNTAPEILRLLQYFFGTIELTRFPLPWHQLSFYAVATATSPRLDRCRAWRERRMAARP